MDSFRNFPVLDMLAAATSIDVMVFGRIMRNTKSNMRK
jgi:hypothetical protein